MYPQVNRPSSLLLVGYILIGVITMVTGQQTLASNFVQTKDVNIKNQESMACSYQELFEMMRREIEELKQNFKDIIQENENIKLINDHQKNALLKLENDVKWLKNKTNHLITGLNQNHFLMFKFLYICVWHFDTLCGSSFHLYCN